MRTFHVRCLLESSGEWIATLRADGAVVEVRRASAEEACRELTLALTHALGSERFALRVDIGRASDADPSAHGPGVPWSTRH